MIRSRCECDRDLSSKLAAYEHEWNQMNHHKWSNPLFDRYYINYIYSIFKIILVVGFNNEHAIFRQAVCTDPQAATSTAFLQAIGEGKFQVVKPFDGVPSLGGKIPNQKGGSAGGGGGGFRPAVGEPEQSNQLSLNVRFRFLQLYQSKSNIF